jgi:hypothetical protein
MFKEIFPDRDIEKALQENYNKLEGLPLDTPLWTDNNYYGTIPPTLDEWISEPVYASIYAKRSGQYRMFKNIHGTYSLQDVGSCDSVTIATGEYDDIVELHVELSGESPAFLKTRNLFTELGPMLWSQDCR